MLLFSVRASTVICNKAYVTDMYLRFITATCGAVPHSDGTPAVTGRW